MGLEQIQVQLVETMGSDKLVAHAAWTSSYDQSKKAAKKDSDIQRVVLQMAENGHGVPFEYVVFVFWIRMPIFADRQHVTHRLASNSGLSGRYRTVPTDFYSIPDDVADLIGSWSSDDYEENCRVANASYREALESLKQKEKDGKVSNGNYKRAREILRGQCPQANMTERMTLINLRSFANFQRHRNSGHAQDEIRLVAKKMLKLVEQAEVAPIAVQALKKNRWLLQPHDDGEDYDTMGGSDVTV